MTSFSGLVVFNGNQNGSYFNGFHIGVIFGYILGLFREKWNRAYKPMGWLCKLSSTQLFGYKACQSWVYDAI